MRSAIARKIKVGHHEPAVLLDKFRHPARVGEAHDGLREARQPPEHTKGVPIIPRGEHKYVTAAAK